MMMRTTVTLVLVLVLVIAGCRDPRELVAESNVTIVVVNLGDDSTVIVDVGGEHREARGDDDEIVEVRLTLPAPAEHAGTIEVREGDDDEARCGAFVIRLPEASSTDSIAVDADELPACALAEGEGEGVGEGEGDEGEGEAGEGEGEGEEGEGEEGEGEGEEGEGGEGEGEGEGEFQPECSGSGACDDGVPCTLDDRCVAGACIGLYDVNVSCGACDAVVCGDVCDVCCIPPDESCDEDACGVCLGACDDGTCTCDSATCAQSGAPDGAMHATCVGAARCRQSANGSASAIIDCFAGATCAADVVSVSSGLITCDQSSCVIDAQDSDVDVRCDETELCVVVSDSRASLFCEAASCSLDCAADECELACGVAASCAMDCDVGAPCTLSCSSGATSCDLDCGAVSVPCVPGTDCTCD